MAKETLNLKDLQEATNAPAYIIKYLRDCNRLPVVKHSTGRGYLTLYDLKAIEIIKEHLAKQGH